jgi:hypothetical protein
MNKEEFDKLCNGLTDEEIIDAINHAKNFKKNYIVCSNGQVISRQEVRPNPVLKMIQNAIEEERRNMKWK